MVGTIKEILTTLITDLNKEKPPLNWVDALQPAAFAYNAGPSEVTSFSPFFLNTGRHPVLPREPLPSLRENEAEAAPIEAYADSLQARLRDTFDFVRTVLDSRRESLQEDIAKQTRSPTYSTGDRVLLNDPRFDARIGQSKPAFALPFTGPYEVIERIGPATYILRALKDGRAVGRQMTVHGTRLRPYRLPAEAARPTTSIPPPALAAEDEEKEEKSPDDLEEPQEKRVQDQAQRGKDDSPAADVRQRHAGQTRPNYAENAKVPEHPRPAVRYSLPPHAHAPASGTGEQIPQGRSAPLHSRKRRR
jgi:hypothetical protein